MTNSEVVTELIHRFTRQDVSVADLYADDVSVHVMFAFPHPLKISGKKAFIAAYEANRANSGGETPEMYKGIEIRDLKVHETTDPNVVIAQWTYVSNNAFGRITNFNIIVAELRDGLITQSRDYHNDITRAQANGTLPELIGMLQTAS
ncbi:nuclear transport factor 2 family protein [Variovorax sp. LT2P21]|uniref:nuclear transport factor 2 family protein n=1 Tax=Variovorax sp. LT2P21 TaxID=3443731 RepID=UPI003F453E6C